MDTTRNQDILELTEAYKNATSSYERDKYSEMIYRVQEMSRDGVFKDLREDLVMAIRHDDLRAVTALQTKIKHREHELYGFRYDNYDR